ncbi:MAG: Gmad2 immunoglobulin-like domain-containing protein [Candidatus Magasanikiibacteriota bacterium]
MKKVIYIFLIVIAVLMLIIVGLRFFIGGGEDTWLCENGQWVKHGNPSEPMPDEICLAQENSEDFNDPLFVVKNNDYVIENEFVSLVHGESIVGEPGSASQTITKLVSAKPVGDIDNDGLDNFVVFLSQTSSGSGTFYYVSVVSDFADNYTGYNALFLGDRILLGETENRQGIIIVNYKDRGENEPMTSEPTIEKQRYFAFEENVLKELNYKKDLIELTSPKPASFISSPLEITGQARGNWFFEASFPVTLTNWDGLIIAEGIAQAQGEWMTTDFVAFKATLNFTADTTVSNRGALILKKDNPSGLPEHDDALEIPVFFE